jgi:hypothetical protein
MDKQNRDWQTTLDEYSLKAYCRDVETWGLEDTWKRICEHVLRFGENENGVLKVSNFGEMYEIGLTVINKQQKKRADNIIRRRMWRW